jgi:hypothetical protein
MYKGGDEQALYLHKYSESVITYDFKSVWKGSRQ